MSMHQSDGFLVPVDATKYLQSLHQQGRNTVAYFSYGDCYDMKPFIERVPNAQPAGLGLLKGWTWHINDNGVANIRFSPLSRDNFFQGPVLHPGTHTATVGDEMTIITFGYIMKISLEDEEKLNAYYTSQGRIRLVHPVQFSHLPSSKSDYEGNYNIDVVTHFDPRHTRDSVFHPWDNDEEKKKWSRGLMQLRVMGVAEGFIHRIYTVLTGNPPIPEPMEVAYFLKSPPGKPAWSPERNKQQHNYPVESTPTPYHRAVRFHQLEAANRVKTQAPMRHGPSPLAVYNESARSSPDPDNLANNMDVLRAAAQNPHHPESHVYAQILTAIGQAKGQGMFAAKTQELNPPEKRKRVQDAPFAFDPAKHVAEVARQLAEAEKNKRRKLQNVRD